MATLFGSAACLIVIAFSKELEETKISIEKELFTGSQSDDTVGVHPPTSDVGHIRLVSGWWRLQGSFRFFRYINELLFLQALVDHP